MPDPTLVAVAASAAAPAVEEALKGFGRTIGGNIGRVARNVADRAIVALQVGFEEYLTTSYNKCRQFKTILNPQQPIDLMSHYVNVTLTCASKTIVDTDLIDEIADHKRVVVTGLAGSGKSMFMKYITVCNFENPKGIIPLFVELRHLNSLTDQDLLTFIRSSCVSKDFNVSEDQFSLSLRAGAMMLVLDGFDELHHEIRDTIQKQILDLEKDYPQTTVVISSRPDVRFNSWSSFYIFKVDELSESQVIKLIQNLEYDGAVKKRFLKEVSSKLYSSHKSFLSSPLLASIMLLTYEEFAEIPQKMHAFYGQAFDTLFQKHDAQKEQYQRKTHTQLARDAFKECFAAFCAVSYLEQRFSFDDEELEKASQSAVKYMKQTSEGFPKSITHSQFIDDLFESVCMLQKDGLETAFVHRSFQEYFSALFVKNLHGGRIKQFLDRYAHRFDDSVIPMAVDMAREVIENEWVIPAIEGLEKNLLLDKPNEDLGGKVAKILPNLFLVTADNRLLVSAHGFEDSCLGTIEAIAKIYPKHLPSNLVFSAFSSVKVDELRLALDVEKYRSEERFPQMMKFLEMRKTDEAGRQHLNVRTEGDQHVLLSREDDWWLSEIGVGRSFETLARAFAAIKREIRGRDRRRTTILEEFF